MVALNDLSKVNPNRLRMFVELERRGSFSAAARQCMVTPSAVRQALASVTAALGDRALFETSSSHETMVLSEWGKEVMPLVNAVVNTSEGLIRHAPQKCILSALPHHALWLAPVFRQHVHELDFRVLHEHDRLEERFDTHVIGPIRASATDAVVGLPPADLRDPSLTVEELYKARLMAQVVRDSEAAQQLVRGGGIELSNLVKHGLLVPPDGTRSRKLLEDRIRDAKLGKSNVVFEAFETKVLAHYGRLGIGITVLPSDIARPWTAAAEFGGHAYGSEHAYDWYPVIDPAGDPLHHAVYLTTRVHPHGVVENVIDAVHVALDDLRLRHILSGEDWALLEAS